MSFSLYDAVIPSNLQILGAVEGLVDKAEAFASEKGIAPAEVIEWRLAADMLPFGYQVKATAEHSLGALEGARAGSFSPSMAPWPNGFDGLREKVRGAVTALKAVDRAEFDALTDRDAEFRMGEMVIPFTGATFLLSFSQPNFYFHATTAYAILRAKGVPLGKKDFLGQLRVRM